MVLYNSLTRKKEIFKPLSSNTLKIYVCGITPYDTTHLGHAFTYVAFDALIRYFRYKEVSVEYTQNVTDIDDDILKRAKKEGKDWRKLGDFWTKKFLTDLDTLNVLPPTHYVKATESMETIITITETLIEKGFAYEHKGNVYFRVKAFNEYGKLSKLAITQMLQLLKERGGDPNDPLKEEPLDFLLWQKSKKDEPSWKSLWGNGRPGWHIECSSMIYDYLGEQIDIHGGGRDLIYPHHESEVAQSESFTGKKPFVKTWMHTAMVMYEGEKMSKSLGNLVMVSDLLKAYSPNAIRFVLLSHHYRKPWEFEESELEEAEKLMQSIAKLLHKKIKKQKISKRNVYIKQFQQAMENDLDTPTVMELVNRLAEKTEHSKESGNYIHALELITTTLGFIF